MNIFRKSKDIAELVTRDFIFWNASLAASKIIESLYLFQPSPFMRIFSPAVSLYFEITITLVFDAIKFNDFCSLVSTNCSIRSWGFSLDLY